MNSFFIQDYDINPRGEYRVELLLENNDRRRIYGNEYICEGNWFGDKISFSKDYCYFVLSSKLYRCKLDNLAYGLYPGEDLLESDNGYYNIITDWND